jgi:hypothetical protein
MTNEILLKAVSAGLAEASAGRIFHWNVTSLTDDLLGLWGQRVCRQEERSFAESNTASTVDTAGEVSSPFASAFADSSMARPPNMRWSKQALTRRAPTHGTSYAS